MKKTNFFISLFLLVSLSTLLAQPQYYNYNTGTSNNVFPFGVVAGKSVQWLFLPGEFNQPTGAPSGKITKIWIWTGANATTTFTPLFIRMAQDVITNLPTGVIYTGTFDTVYYRASVTLTSQTANWMGIQLDKPYTYDSTKSLIVEISQCGATSSSMTVRQTTTTGQKRCYINHSGGCTWTYAGQDASVLNMGIDVIRMTPMYYTTIGTSNNSFPLGIAAGKMVQWLFPPAGQTGSWNTPSPPQSGGFINAFYMWVNSTYPLSQATYSELRMLYGQTELTTLTSGQFYSGTLDTVLFKPTIVLGPASNAWVLFIWDTPKPYDPTKSTVIQLGHCQGVGATGYPQVQFTISGIHRVWSVGGCPYSPYTSGDGYVLTSGLNMYYPTGTKQQNNEVPQAYKLEQNYPNPFNPYTTINYAIPKAGNVELKIYDVLGREVAVLVNEFKQAGNYTATFDASNLASGVYLYTLKSGDFTASKKMILEK